MKAAQNRGITVTVLVTTIAAAVGCGERANPVSPSALAATGSVGAFAESTALQPQLTGGTLTCTPESLSFTAQIGHTSPAQQIVCTNLTLRPVRVENVIRTVHPPECLEGSCTPATDPEWDAALPIQDGCSGQTLHPQRGNRTDSCTITARYTPTRPWDVRPTALAIAHSGDNTPLRIPVVLTPVSPIGTLECTPSSIAFGLILLNETATASVTCSVTGEPWAHVDISGVRASGDLAVLNADGIRWENGFLVPGGYGGRLFNAPGWLLRITVYLFATELRDYAAQITVTHNGTNGPTTNLPATGTAYVIPPR